MSPYRLVWAGANSVLRIYRIASVASIGMMIKRVVAGSYDGQMRWRDCNVVRCQLAIFVELRGVTPHYSDRAEYG